MSDEESSEGRATTYNFSGGTGIGPIYKEEHYMMETSDDEEEMDYPDSDDDTEDDETRTTICGW